jgi:hypothetical protein
MFNKIDKNFFIGSFLVHLVFLILILCFNSSNSINKKFVVYGAYSKKPTKAYFKSLKQTNKSNYIKNNNGRHGQTRKLAQNSNSHSTKNLSKKQKSPIKEHSGTVKQKQSVKTKNKSLQKSKQAKVKQSKQKSPTSLEDPKKQLKNKKVKNKTKQTEKSKKQKKEPEKKIEKEKKEPKKIEEKKQKQKPEEKKPELPQKIEPEKQNETKEQEIKEPGSSEETHDAEQADSDEFEVLDFDQMGEQDPKFEAYQKLIRKEVRGMWKSPLGVPKGTESLLRFTIDRDGNVSNYEVIKNSGILIYELSIFRVAKKFKFDKSLWNKIFTVEFRQ